MKKRSDAERDELAQSLAIVDCANGEYLLHQGVHEMEQYFLLEGILKRVAANADAKEMILRVTDERGIDTSHAVWRLNTPTPYAIVSVTNARVATLSMPQWVEFLDRHPNFKAELEYGIMRLMSEIMAHTITPHLLDAAGRVHRFMRKRGDLAERIPKKALAAYLNLCAETLSRLKQRGKI